MEKFYIFKRVTPVKLSNLIFVESWYESKLYWMFSEFESFLAILINNKKLIAITIVNTNEDVNVNVERTPSALTIAAFGPTIWINISFGIALSRVKTLQGLFIDSFNINNVKANKKVIEFYKKMEEWDLYKNSFSFINKIIINF